MRKSIYMLVLALALTFIVGCATAGKMNRVSLGMTKAQVIDELGNPDTTGGVNGREVLVYYKYATASDARWGHSTEYAVVLENGVVTKYGPSSAIFEPHAKKVIVESSGPVTPSVAVE